MRARWSRLDDRLRCAIIVGVLVVSYVLAPNSPSSPTFRRDVEETRGNLNESGAILSNVWDGFARNVGLGK